MRLLAFLALVLATSLPAEAHDYELDALRVVHPWTRASIGNLRIAPGFFVVENQGSEPDRLIGAASPHAVEVELHVTENGMMRQVEAYEIPAGGTLVLEPSGSHLMIGPLDGPLEEGDSLPVTLVFEKAGPLQVELAVGAADARQGHH